MGYGEQEKAQSYIVITLLTRTSMSPIIIPHSGSHPERLCLYSSIVPIFLHAA